MTGMNRKIDISHKTIVFVAVFLLALWVIYLVRDLIIILFVSVILMSAIAPLVSLFMKLKLPKALGILISYIIIIGVLVGVFASFLPPLIEQSNRLINTLPPLIIEQFNLTDVDHSLLQSQVTEVSKNILSVTVDIFNTIVTVIFLLVITFYLLLDRENLEVRVANLFVGREDRIKRLTRRIEDKLGAWVRGQLTLSLIIGVLSYIGLTLLHIPYALPLALLAAVMEVVPVIGPIIAAIPAIALAITISPVVTAGVAALYFVIQQLENHLIVPQVMKRAVGLNPLVVILAVAVGSRLLGIAGALLAVPIAVVLQIVVGDILQEEKRT